MITKDLADLPTWNTSLRLPLVTDDSELFEFQILLGGITLVLSRLHPVFAKNRFTCTRGLAIKLTHVLECGDPSQGRLSSTHLAQVMAECDRALDPGTLIVIRKLYAETLRLEQESARGKALADFTYSDFLAEEQLASSFARQGSAGSSVVMN
jgi:hypothetical protein